MIDGEKDEDLSLVKSVCEKLGEHFDTVQVFATRFDGEMGTVNVNWGSGNWFARRGQISDWLLKENESSRQSVKTEED